jgi:Fe-S-cluster containining protein
MLQNEIQLADFQAFACTSCGLCCTRPWNIRIEPEVEEGIRGSEFYQRREREGYLPIEVENGKSVARRQRNGDCMFLAEELMCGLHSELGGQGKPVGCQLYPYRATRTPSGTFFTLSFACPPVVAGLDRDLESNRADLTAILAKWPQAADAYNEAQLTKDQALEWGSYLELEQWMLETYDGSRPMDSLLGMAASVSGLAVGAVSWPLPAQPPLDSELLRELLSSYLTGIISVLENEKNHSARGAYADHLREGLRMPSCYFDGDLPVLDLERTLPDWVKETYTRYFLNQVLGKSLLTPSIVSKLLAMAVGYALLVLYAEAFRQARGETELSLQALTLAFEVVEGDVVSHSTALTVFFEDFETTLPKFLLL